VSVPAEQALNIIDPLTNSAVTTFQPAKTYTIRIRFNNPNAGPWRNAYVLHIAEISSGTALRAGSLINSGTVGTVTDTGPTNPQSNSRIINSATKNTVDNPEIQWQAPNDGRVRFQLLRMETNNVTNQAGDRVSQLLESIILPMTGAAAALEGEDGIAPSTGTDATTGSASRFSGELTAGCGRLDASTESGLPIVAFILALGVLGLLCQRRLALT